MYAGGGRRVVVRRQGPRYALPQQMRLPISRLAGFLCLMGVGYAPGCGSGADAPPGASFGGGGSGGSSGSGGGGGPSGGAGGSAATDSGSGGGIQFDGGGCTGPHCSDDLRSIVDCDGKVLEACLGAEGCDQKTVTCMNACAASESAKRSIGCEYYAVFMDQLDQASCFAVFVANSWGQSAQLALEYDGQPLPVEQFAYLPVGTGTNTTYVPITSAGLPPDKVAILFLAGPSGTPSKDNPVCPKPAAVPSGAMLTNATGKSRAFRISSDVPVVAYQINPFGGGSAAVTGASLLIPTAAWDTRYLAVHAAEPGPYPASLNIVAREPTNVTLLPAKAITGGGVLPSGAANVPYTFSLGAGEHAQFTQVASLDGTVIEADKPVGLFGGGRCAQVPTTQYACDHVEQMIPPVQALGSEYVGVNHKSRSGEPGFWRMMGVVDGTKLTWSSDVGGPATLNRGEVAHFFSSFPFVVKSQSRDHPFVLIAHMTGGSTNNMQGVGDADSVLIIPPEQYLRNYLFFADPTYPITNLVVVRSPEPEGGFADVTLDCAGVLGGWKPVGKYEYTRVDLTVGDFQNAGSCTTGSRKMHSAGKFGLWVWGWGSPQTASFTSYVSYGYPGGMNVQPINEVVVSIPR